MERLCLVCNKRFKTYPSKIKIGRGKYCSKVCSLKITSINLSPKTYRIPKGNIPWNFKGWRYCGRNRRYKQIYKPDHPNASKAGYIREHRYIMEQKIGRLLKLDEEIHHINGNGLDNRIENLMIISKSEHLKLEHKSGVYYKKLSRHL